MDLGESTTGDSWYVIVSLVEEKSKKAMCVRKTSVSVTSDEKPPSSYEEAMLRQHQDIDEMLDDVALAISECEIDLNYSGDKIGDIFFNKLLHQAMILQGSWKEGYLGG